MADFATAFGWCGPPEYTDNSTGRYIFSIYLACAYIQLVFEGYNDVTTVLSDIKLTRKVGGLEPLRTRCRSREDPMTQKKDIRMNKRVG